jgi:hypothetical protein
MGRKSASGSGIRDEQPESYFLELRNHFLGFLSLKFLNSLMRIRDPDGDSSDPVSGMEKSRIQDKHPGSATLPKRTSKLKKKPSALKREHTALQNMKFLNLFLFLWVIFALLDLDPDYESGSISTDLIEYESNSDPDPIHWRKPT